MADEQDLSAGQASDGPAPDGPAVDSTTPSGGSADSPKAEAPTTGDASVGGSAAVTPATGDASVGGSAAEALATDGSSADSSPAEAPATDDLSADSPAADAPAADHPTRAVLATDDPAANSWTAGAQAADAPPADRSTRDPAAAKHLDGNRASQAESAVMPLMEHLKELRDRLIRAFIALAIATAASFAVAKQVLVFLIAPMGDTAPQALKPTESLGNYMKVALVCGVTLAMPVIVYQIGRFLAPGLTKQERRYLYLLVPGATLCFVAGVSFAYFVMMPAAIPFLQGFMSDIIEQQWAIGEYLSFVTSLLFWIGVSFELPLFVYFLAKLGIIDAQTLARNRKYAMVIIAILSAVITPTVDPLNMLLVMAPLLVLYELGVILAKIA